VVNEIPVLDMNNNPTEDPLWTSFMGHLVHPDFAHPVFMRHNYSAVNLFNLYAGETVYLIGRGPSLRKHVENPKIMQMLQHPTITTFAMNTAADIFNNNVNLWCGVDRMTKFSPQIAKNPNITKFIPMNRLMPSNFDLRNADTKRNLAYMNSDEKKYAALCPNTIGVQTYIVTKQTTKNVTFGNAFLNCPPVLYGVLKGHKSVLLFAIKICLLLGFKKIVLLGVDFKMDQKEPYYKNNSSDYNQFHVQHNNRLYASLTPHMQEIVKLLHGNKSQYRCKISTAVPIEAMPFIPTVNIQQQLEADINRKTS